MGSRPCWRWGCLRHDWKYLGRLPLRSNSTQRVPAEGSLSGAVHPGQPSRSRMVSRLDQPLLMVMPTRVYLGAGVC